MDDAMLWTIIGGFLATMGLLLTLIGWFLTRIEKTVERLDTRLERIDGRLDRIDAEQRKTHDEVTQIKASLAGIGERLTRGGI